MEFASARWWARRRATRLVEDLGRPGKAPPDGSGVVLPLSMNFVMPVRPLHLAAPLCVVMAALTPASAMAEDTFVFEGRGFGHGVGMSQYGALGAARAGWDAGAILAHYYRGTTLQGRPDADVRVQLRASSASIDVGGAGLVAAPISGGPRTALSGPVRVRATSGRVELVDTSGAIAATGDAIEIGGSEGLVTLDGRRYRGALQLRPSGAGRVQVVNRLRIEEYLYGVVPREVPASWPGAALRAQAIAARSYARNGLRPDRAFDVHPDTRSQVYGGLGAEDPRTSAAVDATRGTVVIYEGEVATTFFHSTSGGHTESVQNVWGSDPRPYLVGVPDPFDATSPYHRWSNPPRFSGAELASRLGLGSAVTGVRVLSRGVSPRVRWVAVTTADGDVVTRTGATIRASLGLRDTWFAVTPAGAPPSGAPDGPAGEKPAVRYLVYAAAPPSAARATSAMGRLRRAGKDVVIVRRRIGGRVRHLVVTGHFAVLANARRERDDLIARGFRGARVGSARAAPRRAEAFLALAGSRRARQQARLLARRVRGSGYSTRIIVRSREGGRVYLVVVGRYRRLARAKATRDELRADGYRAAMVGAARARG